VSAPARLALILALAASPLACPRAAAIENPSPSAGKEASSGASSEGEPPPRVRAWQICQLKSPSKPPYASLRNVDWCNRDYSWGSASLRAGKCEVHEYEELPGPHGTDLFSLGAVVYGDVWGDAAEEAIVLVDHIAYPAKGGLPWRDAMGYVFALQGSDAVQVGLLRSAYGVEVRIEARTIALVRTDASGQSCVHRYSNVGGKFVGKDEC
jgi:hypothetical protein